MASRKTEKTEKVTRRPATKSATRAKEEAPVKADKAKTPRKPSRKTAEPEVLELPTMAAFPSIRKGSKETGYITLLQANLKNRGYYDGPIDGKFGDMTEKAVTDFQKDCGKPLNGSVGPKTWELLQNSKVVRMPEIPVYGNLPADNIITPMPTQPSPGVRILIEGLTRYQAELLVKLFQGHTECRIL